MSAARVCAQCRRPVCTDEDDAACKGKPVCHAPWGDDGECADIFRKRATDALDALAVPGVAGLLARLSRGETDDFRTGEEERAALATLARIAEEASRG